MASVSGVYVQYQVHFDAPSESPLLQLHLQNTAGVKDKIEILLLRIATLEKLFGQPASDEKETKLREGLSMYASGPLFRVDA